MEFTDKLMIATIAGARSVVVGGWMKEECESAALERLVRRPCLTSAVAYRQGKFAAIDELRSLSHHRRKPGGIPIVLDKDIPTEETGFSEVLDKIQCEHILRLCSPRVQKVLRLVILYGFSQEEVAKMLGVSPSRISQLIAHDARRLKAG